MQQLSKCGTSWLGLILPWHFSWLKHMKTDCEHLHRCAHTWHSSIKHFGTWGFELVWHFKCTSSPSSLEMKRFLFHSGQTHTQLTKLRRHCLSKAPFQVSSTHWGNQSNLGGRRIYFHCFCHFSAGTVLFSWGWRHKKIAWAMKEEKPTLQCVNE